MTHEARLILACAREAGNTAASHLVGRALQEPIDWELVVRLASPHRMKPFLHRHLSPHAGAVPPSVLDHLAASYRDTASRNLAVLVALVRLTHSLREAGIRAITFKGPLTAHMAYGDLGLRQSTDLDILVPERDFSRAGRTLQDRGLTPLPPLSPRQLAALRRYRNAWVFGSEGGSFHVDLHWRLLADQLQLLPDERGMWDRAVSANLAGYRFETLGPPDLLLYFCARAAVDSWRAVFRIADISAAARELSPDDWHLVMEHAVKAGKSRMVLIGVGLAHELLDAAIPEQLLRASRGITPVARRIAAARDEILRPECEIPGIVRRDLRLLGALDSLPAHVHFFTSLPFSPGPRDIALVDLPVRTAFLYRGIRVVRVTLKLFLMTMRAVVRAVRRVRDVTRFEDSKDQRPARP